MGRRPISIEATTRPANRPRWTGRRLLEIHGVDRSTAAGRLGARMTTCWPRSAAALAAYVSLTKPRLVLLVLVTVAVGFLLGPRGSGSHATFSSLAATLVGTALVAGGGALNQWLERERDARMRRTANRALPARPSGTVGSRWSSAVCSPSRGRRSCSWGQTCWRPRSRS